MTPARAGLRALKGVAALLLCGGVIALGFGHHPVRTLAPQLAAPPELTLQMQRVSLTPLEGAEIICFDHHSGTVFATCAQGIAAYRLTATNELAQERFIQPAGANPQMPESNSHVTIDPAGRGVIACTIIPSDAAGLPGSIAILSASSGETLARVIVGFNPDAASFTSDGSQLLVVNEGEPRMDAAGVIVDPPGSLSVIATGKATTTEDFRAIAQRDVRTIYPSARAIDSATTESPIRIHPRNRSTPTLDLEPESIAIAGRRAYITLQESNAIGVFDLDAMDWVRIAGLGSFKRIIDASRQDQSISISTRCSGMPMPDQIGLFHIGSARYLLTADEGDTRGDATGPNPGLGDEMSVADLQAAGRLSPRALAALPPDARNLQVCAFSGELDAAGRIDAPLFFGARSATIWDADTLEPLSSTGSSFEQLMALHAPALFNASGSESKGMDSRSDRRGPEPEGVSIGLVDGRPVGFVTLERPGALAALDLSDPHRVRVIGFEVCAAAGQCGPEGVLFIPADKSPSGQALLIVAFEASGHVAVYRVEPILTR